MEPQSAPHRPSLAEAAIARLRSRQHRRGTRGGSHLVVVPFDRAITIGVLAGLALAGGAAAVQTRRLDRASIALEAAAIRTAEGRQAAARLAAAMARPPLDDRLQAIAAHLPPATTLEAAAADPHGKLTLDLATADPDALRDARARDRWFAPFRETGQATDDAGRLRVTLTAEGR